MGAVAAGRFGSAMAFVLLPLIAALAARMFSEGPGRSRRSWATGLLIAIAAAFVPLLWVIAFLGALLAAMVFRRSGRGMLRNLGVAALIAPVLLLPWSAQLATQPTLLFLEARKKVPGLAVALPARSLMLLSRAARASRRTGSRPVWPSAALAALLLAGGRTLIMAGWSVALLGLLVSIVVSRMLLTTDDASKRVPGWPGISLAIAAGGLVLAATVAADALPAALGGGRWRRPAGLGVLILAAALLCSAPLLAAGAWVATGVRGPAGGAAGPVLPPFVSVSSDNGLRPRTLVLRAEGGTVTYEVLRGADPVLGSTDLTVPAAAQRTLDTAVSTLVAQGGGDAQDQGQILAALGIGYVLLPAPADARTGLHAEQRCRPAPGEQDGQLPAVAGGADHSPGPGRRAGRQARDGTLRAGERVRRGRAARRGDAGGWPSRPAGWSATLNGTALQSVPSPACAWAQAFRSRPAAAPSTSPTPSGPDPDRRAGRTSPAGRDWGWGCPAPGWPGKAAQQPLRERTAGRRREPGRDPAADGLGDPELEPESPPGREDTEPSRDSPLSRRAVAAAGRTGTARAGGLRAAAERVAGGPGRRAAAAGSGAAGPGTPGLSGPGPGAPPSGPGTGRRGTLGAPAAPHGKEPRISPRPTGPAGDGHRTGCHGQVRG